MSPELLAQVLAELMPYVEATAPGRDGFTGYRTTRTGALVARSPACRTLVLDPLVRAMCDAVLLPNCERYQLHLTQVIRIMGGQAGPADPSRPLGVGRPAARAGAAAEHDLGAVAVHVRERGDAGGARLDRLARQARGRGRTRSATPRWTPARCCSTAARCSTAAGRTRPTSDRIGLNITYALGWLRQEENQYLACPPEIARTLDPELQDADRLPDRPVRARLLHAAAAARRGPGDRRPGVGAARRRRRLDARQRRQPSGGARRHRGGGGRRLNRRPPVSIGRHRVARRRRRNRRWTRTASCSDRGPPARSAPHGATRSGRTAP